MENKNSKSLAEMLIEKGIKPHFPIGFYLSKGKPSAPADCKIVSLPYYQACVDSEFVFYKPISRF
jgi:hypothetical protein